jgi:hypothetical protein
MRSDGRCCNAHAFHLLHEKAFGIYKNISCISNNAGVTSHQRNTVLSFLGEKGILEEHYQTISLGK